MRLLRGVVISVATGTIRRISAITSYLLGEKLYDRDFFQHYGFASQPLEGAEVVIVGRGNFYVSVAEDDRRYRLAVQPGEVALYTDEGDHIHFKRGKIVELKAQTKLILATPQVECTGSISAAGDVSDGVSTLAAMRTTYNPHVHQDPVSGVTGTPQPQMGAS
ncbi:MAG: phage baseplate assembly protein V [Elusimicrobia bacterium]|nr:phage baseplate assembly protein V [Elusimicrobiota bacterium]